MRDLQSFVAERERQLEVKVVATAQGQPPAAARPHHRTRTFAGLRPQSYRAALERKFNHNTVRSWPMRYEVTPHHSAAHEYP